MKRSILIILQVLIGADRPLFRTGSNAVEYVTAANKAAEYDGRGAYAMYSEDVVNKVLNHSDPANYPDNDWLKMAINNFAPQMQA